MKGSRAILKSPPSKRNALGNVVPINVSGSDLVEVNHAADVIPLASATECRVPTPAERSDPCDTQTSFPNPDLQKFTSLAME